MSPAKPVRKYAKWLSACALAAIASVSAIADAALTAQSGASVSFVAVGPAGMKIEGKTSDLTTKDDGKQLQVLVDLRNLDTGIGLRDKHMRDKYLGVGSTPTATLTVNRADLQFPAVGASATGDAPGKLNLHGVTKDVKLHYSTSNTAGVYNVKGNFTIDMTDYQIEVPSYLGVTVKPGVDVTANFSAVDR